MAEERKSKIIPVARLARAGDETGIAEIFNEGHRTGNFIYTASNEFYDFNKIERLRVRLESPGQETYHFVALTPAEEMIIGVVNAHLKKHARIKHEFEMGWMVHPDYQGRGVAGALLKFSLDFLKEKGFRRAEAEAAVENPASWKLAVKLGFEIEGLKKQALHLDDGRYVDCYALGKIL